MPPLHRPPDGVEPGEGGVAALELAQPVHHGGVVVVAGDLGRGQLGPAQAGQYYKPGVAHAATVTEQCKGQIMFCQTKENYENTN